ncbi:MAG: hypothetical protein WBP33_09090 [Saprospiraceae bacterium]|nr:hypothetical protein [Candidatus Vicinibacter proximus]
MKIKLLFIFILCIFHYFEGYSQVDQCPDDLSSILQNLKLSDGEHLVCTTPDGKKIMAIVKESKVLDLVLRDRSNNVITRGSKTFAKAKKGKKDTIDSVFPVEIKICDKDSKGRPINCKTYKII